MSVNLIIETIELPEEYNIILGQSHFIKTVEDLYEAVVSSVPNIQFGLAFNEASGPCLVRFDGNDDVLSQLAVQNIKRIGAGHTFLIIMKNAFPINVLPAVKDCREVVRIFCATANPVQVIVAETEQGRGIIGVIDGHSPKGVEAEADVQWRLDFLKKIGYKR